MGQTSSEFKANFKSTVLTVALVLQCYVCRRRLSSVTLCIVAKRCVLEQKLLLRAYRQSYIEKSIGTKMNDLDLCLEVVQCHVNHDGVNISKTT